MSSARNGRNCHNPPRLRRGLRCKGDHLRARVEIEEFCWVNMVDEMQSMSPLIQRLKPLGKDVGAHIVRARLDQVQPSLLEDLVKPMDTDAMRPTHVPHGRVLTCAAHLDHSGVVFMEHAERLTLEYSIPEGQTGDTDHPQGRVRSHNFSLRSTVADCGLLARHSL